MNEKLTAYVLNELPPDERAEFEAQMKTDPALRQQAEEMKVFCAMLSEQVANDESPALTSQQRVSVMRAFTTEAPEKKIVRPFWRHPALLVPAAIAACVAFAMVWDTRLTESGFAPDAMQASREKVLAENVHVSQAKVERRAPVPSAPKPAPITPAKPRTEIAAAPAPTLPPVASPAPPKGAAAGDQTRVMQVADSKLKAGAPAAPAAAAIPGSPAAAAPVDKQIVASAKAPATGTAIPGAKDVAGMPLAAAKKPALQNGMLSRATGEVLHKTQPPVTAKAAYASQWRGTFIIRTAGAYTFSPKSSEYWRGAPERLRMSIDGVLVLDHFGGSMPVHLAAGSHEIRLESNSNAAALATRLWYAGPDTGASDLQAPAGVRYAEVAMNFSNAQLKRTEANSNVLLTSAIARWTSWNPNVSPLASITWSSQLPTLTLNAPDHSAIAGRDALSLGSAALLPGTRLEGGAIATNSDDVVGILGRWGTVAHSDWAARPVYPLHADNTYLGAPAGNYRSSFAVSGAAELHPATPAEAGMLNPVHYPATGSDRNLGDHTSVADTSIIRFDAASSALNASNGGKNSYSNLQGFSDTIGSLSGSTPSETVDYIPVLGDIPILGRAFATKSSESNLALGDVSAPQRFGNALLGNASSLELQGNLVAGKDVNAVVPEQGKLVLNGGTLKYDDGRTSGTTNLGFTVNTDAVLDAAKPYTSLTMGGTIDNSGSGALAFGDGGIHPAPTSAGSGKLRNLSGNTTHSGGVTLAAESDGSAGLKKFGEGNLTLDGANTYTGGVTVNGGTIVSSGEGVHETTAGRGLSGRGRVSDDVASGKKDPGELAPPADGNTLGIAIMGAGRVVFGGTSGNTYTGDTTITGGALTGTTTIRAGTLRVSNANVIGDTRVEKAAEELASASALPGGGATTAGRGGVLIANDLTVIQNNTQGAAEITATIVDHAVTTRNSATLPGSASGAPSSGAITKSGAGTWTMTGTNGFTGDITVNQGKLTMAGNSSRQTGAKEGVDLMSEPTVTTTSGQLATVNVTRDFNGTFSPPLVNGIMPWALTDSPAAPTANATNGSGVGALAFTHTGAVPMAPAAAPNPVTIISGGILSVSGPSPSFTAGQTVNTTAGSTTINSINLSSTSPAAPAAEAGSFKSSKFGLVADVTFGNMDPITRSAGSTVDFTGNINGNITISPALPTITAPLVDNPTVTIQIAPGPPSEQELRERELARMSEREAHLRRHLIELEQRNAQIARRNTSNETYTRIYENPFLFTQQQPLSTFSIDVDTASYANVRRFLNQGQLPPPDAVRLEELINYFPYSYEGPSDGKPFGVMVDVADAPWQPLHRLVRVALKGREVRDDRGPANFVFLVDVSGSMGSEDKLPLVKRSLEMLTRQLGKDDRVAMVVYAGSSGLVLPSTAGTERDTILEAIGRLQSGGSTNGAGGITQAYQEAAKNFIKGGVNRVILCTDGDFNVGISTPEALEKLIAEKAKSRIFLSVLGFGTGNLKDRTMETLADKGNGNYAYIDSLSEARKVLVEQMNGTLVTIAKDVKIQVEFNPTQVAAYRLLGYENRLMAKEDFNNDKKDAGEIGAGHTVTALYEVVPARVRFPDGRPAVDELKYAPKAPQPAAEDPAVTPDAVTPARHELMTVKLRYKQPEGDKSDLLEVPVTDKEAKLSEAPKDFQFAASVAGFGMLLRGSQHAGELNWDMVRDMALHGKGEDTLGYRGEFLQLIDKARGLMEVRR